MRGGQRYPLVQTDKQTDRHREILLLNNKDLQITFVNKDVPVPEEKHECLPFENVHDHGPEPAHSCPNSGKNNVLSGTRPNVKAQN